MRRIVTAVGFILVSAFAASATPHTRQPPQITVDQLVSMVHEQIAKFWDVPNGVKVSKQTALNVTLHLNINGYLAVPPEFPDEPQQMQALGDDYPYLKKAAIKALNDCAPLHLPPALYRSKPGWDVINLRFTTK